MSHKTLTLAAATLILISANSAAATENETTEPSHTHTTQHTGQHFADMLRASLSTPTITITIPETTSTPQFVIETVDKITPKPAPPPTPKKPSPQTSSQHSSTLTTSPIVSLARQHIGTPYRHGGTTPNGFDCSGFTQYVYAQTGINLPRTSSAQRYAGTIIPRSQAQPGDLIWTPGHVGIYVGNGKQIDAPRPGKTIQERKIWQKNPTFIRITP